MAKFEVLVLPIDKVEEHPNADRLNVNHIRGYVAVTNKKEDDTPRYSVGDLVVYVPESSVVPEGILKRFGYWDAVKGKGFLAGSKGDRVKSILIRGVLSQGIILPLSNLATDESVIQKFGRSGYVEDANGHKRYTREGENVADFLGITKWVPPVPSSMDGEMTNIGIENVVIYDIEPLQKYPDLLKGKEVVVTEKLHGTFVCFGFNRKLSNPDLFEGNMFATSMSAAAHGLAFKDTENNRNNNIYQKVAHTIFPEIKRYLVEMPGIEELYLFGEIFGPGIQDMHYGLESSELRLFDVKLKMMGAGPDTIPFGFIGVRKYDLFMWMNIASVPVLWACVYDFETIKQLANDTSVIGGGLREGVVVTAEDESLINGMRPQLKYTSAKYLLRSNGTEYN
jgi:RNA ligase (TIGR02306 family)